MEKKVIDAETFWKTTFSKKVSTFGTSEKATIRPPEHEGWNIADSSTSYKMTGKHCEVKGRPRINSTLSCMLSAPGPGHYGAPDIRTYKKRISEGRIVSQKSLDYSTCAPAPNSYKIPSKFDSLGHSLADKSWKLPKEFEKFHVDPGPGSYNIGNTGSKYERDPKAILKPKDSTQPRKTIAPSNLDVIETYNTDIYDQTDMSLIPGPGLYNMENDPSRKRVMFKIGEIRPLLEQKEILKPGPGDYSIERAGSFGKGSILSSPSPLLRLRCPQLNPSADPDLMTLKLNKKVWAKFESEYSFPKKENARAVRGRVFNSTVQNFPQHHLGAFSPGAYLKT